MNNESKKTDKASLRKETLAKRDSLSKIEIQELSRIICDKILALPCYQSADQICFYAPIKSEVRVDLILEKARMDGKKTFLPKIMDREMDFYEVDRDTKMISGAFKIPEPESGRMLVSGYHTLVLMPGSVFSPEKDRIGYGGGFYDRFLRANRKVKKVAVCYDFQIVEDMDIAEFPRDRFDVKPDYIVTDKRMIE